MARMGARATSRTSTPGKIMSGTTGISLLRRRAQDSAEVPVTPPTGRCVGSHKGFTDARNRSRRTGQRGIPCPLVRR